MKVLLHVDFLAQPNDGSQGFARLAIPNLPFAPSSDVEFEHPVWHSSRKATRISWNTETQSFYVALAEERCETREQCQAAKQMYATHGWSIDADPS
jgi:hypothetical protein